jgi:hypothetical protein
MQPLINLAMAVIYSIIFLLEHGSAIVVQFSHKTSKKDALR